MSPAAWASQWWILDFGTQRCESATNVAARRQAPEFRSPLALRDFMRSTPEAQILLGYKGVRVTHLGDGRLLVVLRMSHGNMNYFNSLTACEAVKKAAIEDGNMPNLNELR